MTKNLKGFWACYIQEGMCSSDAVFASEQEAEDWVEARRAYITAQYELFKAGKPYDETVGTCTRLVQNYLDFDQWRTRINPLLYPYTRFIAAGVTCEEIAVEYYPQYQGGFGNPALVRPNA